MPISKFESDLEDFYEAHKRSHLNKRLDRAAQLMRETLLISALHHGLFDEPNQPDTEVREVVEELRTHVAANDFDRVEEDIDSVLDQLDEELDNVRSTFRTERHNLLERVSGFKSLNDRIERIEDDRIDTLLRDLQTVEDSLDELDGDFDSQLTAAEENGEEIAVTVTTIEDELFEPFRGSDIEDVVRDLIRGETLTLTDCDPETYTALRESDLDSYVNLALEGEE